MSLGSYVRHGAPFVTSILILGFSAVFSGCGGGDTNARKPVAAEQASVTGTVTNAGKPVTATSTIIFECAEKSATAAGIIDAQGKFTLGAGDPGIGIPMGTYRVMIRPPGEAAPPTASPSSDAYKAKMMQGGASMTPAAKGTDIPAAVQTLESSPIKRELKPGANTIDLDLSKAEG